MFYGEDSHIPLIAGRRPICRDWIGKPRLPRKVSASHRSRSLF